MAADLGVDAVFVGGARVRGRAQAIAAALPGCTRVANMVEAGKTPLLTPAELHDLGSDLITVSPLGAAVHLAPGPSPRAWPSSTTRARSGATSTGWSPSDEFNELVDLDGHAGERRGTARHDRRPTGDAGRHSPFGLRHDALVLLRLTGLAVAQPSLIDLFGKNPSSSWPRTSARDVVVFSLAVTFSCGGAHRDRGARPLLAGRQAGAVHFAVRGPAGAQARPRPGAPGRVDSTVVVLGLGVAAGVAPAVYERRWHGLRLGLVVPSPQRPSCSWRRSSSSRRPARLIWFRGPGRHQRRGRPGRRSSRSCLTSSRWRRSSQRTAPSTPSGSPGFASRRGLALVPGA